MRSVRKIALVTGASSGIGWEFAKILAKNEIDVILVARNASKLQELADEVQKLGVKAHVFATDLTDQKALEDLCRRLDSQEMAVEYLINNAGFGGLGFFIQTDWAKEQQMLTVNVVALTHLTKHFVKQMVSRGSGKI